MNNKIIISLVLLVSSALHCITQNIITVIDINDLKNQIYTTKDIIHIQGVRSSGQTSKNTYDVTASILGKKLDISYLSQLQAQTNSFVGETIGDSLDVVGVWILDLSQIKLAEFLNDSVTVTLVQEETSAAWVTTTRKTHSVTFAVKIL